jgi:hypothetical protein
MTTATKAKPDTTSDEPFRETLVYEGKRYVLESIDTREFNRIETESTRTEFDNETGAKTEVLDGKMQMEALMRRMIIEGLPRGGPERLPIRHHWNLRQRINELCFGVLPNEFKPGDEKEEADEDGEAKGEG